MLSSLPRGDYCGKLEFYTDAKIENYYEHHLDGDIKTQSTKLYITRNEGFHFFEKNYTQ